MSAFLRRYGQVAVIDGIPLITYGGTDYLTAPAIVVGDVKISKDGGDFTNIAVLPTVIPTGGTSVRVTLSSVEMQANRVVVRFVDQSDPKEWLDQELIVENYYRVADVVGAQDLEDYVERIRDLVDDICGVPSISLAAADSGSLSAGTVNVRVSAVTEFGETLACGRVSVTVTEGQKVVVTITRVPQASSYRVYASMDDGIETLQTEVALTQAVTQTATISSISLGSDLLGENTGSVVVPYRSYKDAAEAAIYRYSGMFPLELYEDNDLESGVKAYDLPSGYLGVVRIQYPLDEYPPEYLEHDDYFIKDEQWCFVIINPATGKQARVYYNTVHTVDTIPARHFEPICNIAASIICEQIASRYTRLSRRVVGAEAIDYRMRATDSRNDAEMFLKTASRGLGISDLKPDSSSAVVDWYKGH